MLFRRCMFGVLIMLPIGSVLLLAYLLMVPRISVHQLRVSITTELPLGTDRETVEAWLDSRSIPWSEIVQESDGRVVGIEATVKNVYRIELFQHTELTINLYFDERDKLRSFTVEEDTYGL